MSDPSAIDVATRRLQQALDALEVAVERRLDAAREEDKLANQLSTLDQFGPAAEALEESVALWESAGVPLRHGDALRRLSVAYYRLCRGPEERATAERALEVLEPLGASRELAWALSRLAGEFMDSDPDRCLDYASRARAMASSF